VSNLKSDEGDKWALPFND